MVTCLTFLRYWAAELFQLPIDTAGLHPPLDLAQASEDST